MKRKTFDCVEMKDKIQRKRRSEYDGLSLEERKDLMHRRISGDPILGPVYRNILERGERPHLIVAEDAPRYETKRGL